jgi:transcriptional regulator with GAF, ATPase, and Fis domain
MITQPPTPAIFDQVHQLIAAGPGVRLFTVLQWFPETRTLRRVATSHPREYPLGAEKTVAVAQSWLSQVVDRRQPFFAGTLDEVAAVFSDAELIESLGCGAVINVPILDGDRVLGVLAILDAADRYDEASVSAVWEVVDNAAPALAEALHSYQTSPGEPVA